MANGTGLSPTAELAMNGNGLVPNQEDKRPLEHIQTYRFVLCVTHPCRYWAYVKRNRDIFGVIDEEVQNGWNKK